MPEKKKRKRRVRFNFILVTLKVPRQVNSFFTLEKVFSSDELTRHPTVKKVEETIYAFIDETVYFRLYRNNDIVLRLCFVPSTKVEHLEETTRTLLINLPFSARMCIGFILAEST